MVSFIVYEVDPDGSFGKALSQAQKVSDDLSPAFRLISQDFYQTQAPIFRRSSPGPYKDLSEAYKKRKKAKFGRIYPILKANGFLEVAASVENGSGNITEIGPKELRLGVDESSIPYAIFHQEGTKKMARRPYLFIGPEEPKIGILNEFYAQKLKESGLGETKP